MVLSEDLYTRAQAVVVAVVVAMVVTAIVVVAAVVVVVMNQSQRENIELQILPEELDIWQFHWHCCFLSVKLFV